MLIIYCILLTEFERFKTVVEFLTKRFNKILIVRKLTNFLMRQDNFVEINRFFCTFLGKSDSYFRVWVTFIYYLIDGKFAKVENILLYAGKVPLSYIQEVNRPSQTERILFG